MSGYKGITPVYAGTFFAPYIPKFSVEMKLDEGRVYGARYYIVEPVFMGHIETWFRQEWKAMEEWAIATYGEPGSVWEVNEVPLVNHRWYMNDRRFWFRNEADRTMFVLRWS